MATTLKKVHIPRLPAMQGTKCNYKISIFTKFFKIYDIYNILLQTIFQTTWHFLMLGVTVLNTIDTHEFCPSIIPGSKFKVHHNIS